MREQNQPNSCGITSLRRYDLVIKPNSAARKDFGLLKPRAKVFGGLGPELDSAGRVIREGLNFHDSRATFATWAASPDPKTGVPRLDLLSLARQPGHKNLKMLQRYYRPKSEDIAKRLDSMSEG